MKTLTQLDAGTRWITLQANNPAPQYPRLRVVVRGYHPTHNWERFHVARGGWFRMWGIAAWDEVGTVTCEATNESNGDLYPVSEDRDTRAWDDDTVDTLLDQVLDDCYSEAGGADRAHHARTRSVVATCESPPIPPESRDFTR